MTDSQILDQQLKLTLVVSRREASPLSLLELAARAFDGGVTAIQLREKNMGGRDFWKQALKLREYCGQRSKLFIINDRLDLALATEADGLHLGQNDLPVEVAARLWPGHILGVSVSTVAQAQAALAGGATYLGLGAMFPTGSKDDVKLISSEQVRAILDLGVPSVAIGGINVSNAGELWPLGFSGLAVISAVAAASDPAEAARQLLAGSEKG